MSPHILLLSLFRIFSVFFCRFCAVSSSEIGATARERIMSEEDRIGAGITEEMFRLSVGTEDVEDLIHDFESTHPSALSVPNILCFLLSLLRSFVI
jgi:hypothetical protein